MLDSFSFCIISLVHIDLLLALEIFLMIAKMYSGAAVGVYGVCVLSDLINTLEAICRRADRARCNSPVMPVC